MKPSNKPSRDEDRDTVIHDLRQELAARAAEADWLKARYEAELRAAFATRPGTSPSKTMTVARTGPDQKQEAEAMKRLQAELDRALAAEMRYLDRIDELKDQVDRLTKGGPVA